MRAGPAGGDAERGARRAAGAWGGRRVTRALLLVPSGGAAREPVPARGKRAAALASRPASGSRDPRAHPARVCLAGRVAAVAL